MTKLGGVMAINDIAVASWLAAYNLVTPTKLLMQISSRKRLSQNIASPLCATPVPYQIQPYHVCLDWQVEVIRYDAYPIFVYIFWAMDHIALELDQDRFDLIPNISLF